MGGSVPKGLFNFVAEMYPESIRCTGGQFCAVLLLVCSKVSLSEAVKCVTFALPPNNLIGRLTTTLQPLFEHTEFPEVSKTTH